MHAPFLLLQMSSFNRLNPARSRNLYNARTSLVNSFPNRPHSTVDSGHDWLDWRKSLLKKLWEGHLFHLPNLKPSQQKWKQCWTIDRLPISSDNWNPEPLTPAHLFCGRWLKSVPFPLEDTCVYNSWWFRLYWWLCHEGTSYLLITAICYRAFGQGEKRLPNITLRIPSHIWSQLAYHQNGWCTCSTWWSTSPHVEGRHGGGSDSW